MKNSLKDVINDFLTLDEYKISKKYNTTDARDWKIGRAKDDVKNNIDNVKAWQNVNYRPFDIRKTFYTGKQNGFVCNGRYNVMKHLLSDNLGLITKRGFDNEKSSVSFITKYISDRRGWSSPGMQGAESIFPLYLYPDTNGQQSAFEGQERVPNLNMEIVYALCRGLLLKFSAEQIDEEGIISPIDILDYIYAVLHSPSYREKYKEFLKIDFPRVPYPTDQKTFFELVKLGGQLREIHLLESPVVEKYITQYPEDGDNVVKKPRFENSPPLEGCPTGGVVENAHTEPTLFIKGKPIYFNTKTDLPYNPKLKPLLKELRYAHNLSEVLFWKQVHKGHFHKIDFDRQRIIGNYIVDFYVKKLGLVIEIDGSSHEDKEQYDAERQVYLESLGLKVCRIKAGDVLNRMSMAMSQVEDFIIEEYSNEPPRPLGTPPKEGNVGRVYINETQYFANVPEVAWNFYIGGYQPAQKWLKDRKERELSYEDILHYQKIIVTLNETDRIMGEIDKIKI